jgi:membrane fusion protein (multidrug efflux system)
VNKTSTWILAAVLTAGLAGVQLGCTGRETNAEEAAAEGGAGGSETKADETESAVPVEVVTLGRGAIEEVLRFSTNLEAESEVAVFAEANRKVVALNVEEGARVARGAVLARLQDDEQRTRLAKVESQLAKARREHDRQKRLYADELISEQAFNDATYELEQLELALVEAQRDLSYTEVRAPIGGTVTRRLVNLGDFVNVHQEMFHLVDFDSIVARVFVPEKELVRLGPDQEARISAPALGGESFAGAIDRLAPVVDPKSGTVKVTVAIPGKPPGLKPGMYVDVELVTAVRPDALLVPKRALVYDDDQIFVYRLADDLRVERVLLEPRLEDKLYVEPVAGVAAGDRVVVAGQAGLKNGVLVRLVGAGAPPEAAAPAADETTR